MKKEDLIERIDGSWALDHTSGELIWTDEVFDMFEIAKSEQPSYELFFDTVHPLDRAMVSRALTDSLNNRTPYRIRHRILLPGGRVKWMCETAKTSYSPSGPRISIGTVHDITQTMERIEVLAIDSINRLAMLGKQQQAAVLSLIDHLYNDPATMPANVARIPRRA